MIKGIDVSENNGHLSQAFWNRIANLGYKFAYIRCSYGRYEADPEFAHNVERAHNAGLKVGAYHYSYALNRAQAEEEARHCREVIDNSGVFLELPVFYDMEDADYYKDRHGFAFDPAEITDMCRIFGETLGLNWGVYASYSWLEDYIDWRSLGCPVWNAEWGSTDDLKGYVWQYTDEEWIDGKCFDANIMYTE